MVQQLEICFSTLARWWMLPKSAALSTVWERAGVWGHLCIWSNCKTCTFYLYWFSLGFFFFFTFYTYYSVESSGYIENALYFSISQMNYCHPQDFSCTYFVHLGPKTANRIPIFPLTVLILPSSLLYSNINVDSLFIFLWSEYWEYSLVKSIFPKSRTVRSFN